MSCSPAPPQHIRIYIFIKSSHRYAPPGRLDDVILVIFVRDFQPLVLKLRVSY